MEWPSEARDEAPARARRTRGLHARARRVDRDAAGRGDAARNAPAAVERGETRGDARGEPDVRPTGRDGRGRRERRVLYTGPHTTASAW
eukprot:31295-Pelagococcus_subviridis.AAC.4